MASGVATNRTNIELPASVSSTILQKTQEASAIMQLAQKIDLPGNGVEIPMITGDPAATWVSETGLKPVSNPSLLKKVMTAYKLAVIVPFSMEFRRDANALYNALVSRLPNALGYKFDQTVIGAVQTPGNNFDNFASCQAQDIGTDPFAGFVAADGDIADNGGIMNGIALAPKGKSIVLGATDQNKRPLFIASTAQGGVPSILGSSVYVTKGLYKTGDSADIVGVAGDWTQAMYGTVEGVKISISEEATLSAGTQENPVTINLFQQNMFAVRAEIELGFRADTDCFNVLTYTEES